MKGLVEMWVHWHPLDNNDETPLQNTAQEIPVNSSPRINPEISLLRPPISEQNDPRR
jgi:hypothetical protein